MRVFYRYEEKIPKSMKNWLTSAGLHYNLLKGGCLGSFFIPNSFPSPLSCQPTYILCLQSYQTRLSNLIFHHTQAYSPQFFFLPFQTATSSREASPGLTQELPEMGKAISYEVSPGLLFNPSHIYPRPGRV